MIVDSSSLNLQLHSCFAQNFIACNVTVFMTEKLYIRCKENSVAKTPNTQNSNKIVITNIESCPRTFHILQFEFKLMPQNTYLVKLHYSYHGHHVNFSSLFDTGIPSMIVPLIKQGDKTKLEK